MEFIPSETIELDRPRTLSLSFRVLRKFKEKTGRDFNRCLAAGFSSDDMLGLLYVSFSEEDPDLTESKLEDMLHAGRIPEISEKIIKLVAESFSKSEGDEKN